MCTKIEVFRRPCKTFPEKFFNNPSTAIRPAPTGNNAKESPKSEQGFEVGSDSQTRRNAATAAIENAERGYRRVRRTALPYFAMIGSTPPSSMIETICSGMRSSVTITSMSSSAQMRPKPRCPVHRSQRKVPCKRLSPSPPRCAARPSTVTAIAPRPGLATAASTVAWSANVKPSLPVK